jgi:flagellar hook-basal body complex protein FliE
MTSGLFQSVGLVGKIQNSPIGSSGIMPMSPTDSLDETKKSSFKDVMGGLANNLNQSLDAPDKLLKSSMSGDSDVDIHDVMTAMAKAEINVSVATQVTSKVIQAYDKIMQISV